MPPVPTLPRLITRTLQPLPLGPLQLPLSLVLRSVVARHPHIFERLGEHAHKRFGLEPSDLPFSFVLAPHPETPSLVAVRSLPAGIPVRIAGPLLALLGLIDGSYDGDALFFSRDLVVEGDVEAVLALRNAIDDAGVDLVADTAALFGPLAPLSERLLAGALLRLKDVAGAAKHEGARTWN
ncbi:sterol-binding protein [Bradyrhizobium sp. LMTR 3]|nr:sterol-binding protein [Bradyrhizobium sp. LMTR 3]